MRAPCWREPSRSNSLELLEVKAWNPCGDSPPRLSGGTKSRRLLMLTMPQRSTRQSSGIFRFDFGASAAEATEAGARPPTRTETTVNLHRSAQNDNPARARRQSPSSGSPFPPPTVSTADILKFLIDRTGYIKLLEEEDTPEAMSRSREPARTRQCRHGFARSRRDTRRVSRSCSAGGRCRRLRRARPDHADEPACGEGPGISPGLPQRPGRRIVSRTRAPCSCRKTSKKSAAFAMWG